MSTVSLDRTMAFLTHNWGEDQSNHLLVGLVNNILKSLGIDTWFDEDRMTGEVRDIMARAIENTRCVVVFITAEYRRKVNGTDDRDNCRYEFKYAVRELGPQKMIPVVVDKTMRNPATWKGILGAELGGKLYIDMTDHDDKNIEEKTKELYEKIIEVMGDGEKISAASSEVSAPLSEVEELRRRLAEVEQKLAAATVFTGTSGGGEKEDSSVPQKVNITCKSGDVYSFRFEPGDKYEGDFVNGKPHGKGVRTLATGNKYEGDFVDGKYHGKGVYTWPNGSKYEGDYVDDKITGKGVYTWKDGQKYEGDYVDGKYHGKGVHTWPDGRKYEGDYVDDKRHGKGVFTQADGRKYRSEWQNGNRTGSQNWI